MTIYVDTSALVKRYIEEPGSEAVQALVDGEPHLASSLVLGVEMPAAFARARREGNITAAGERAANRAFDASWPALQIIPFTSSLARTAGAHATQHGLKAYDAVHLASALFLRFATGQPVTLATFDRALWLAATDETLDVWPTSLNR